VALTQGAKEMAKKVEDYFFSGILVFNQVVESPPTRQ